MVEFLWIAAPVLALGAGFYYRTTRVRAEALAVWKTYEALFQGGHELKFGQAETIAGFDQEFYEFATRDLQDAGAQLLGDIENLTIRRLYPKIPYVVRMFSLDEGSTRAAIKQVGSSKICALVTEFEQGQVLITFYGPDPPDQLDLPDWVEKQIVVGPTAGLAAHRGAVIVWRTVHPEDAICPVHSPEDALAAHARYQDRLASFRQSRGYLTVEELVRIFGPGRQKLVEEIHREMSRNLEFRLSSDPLSKLESA